MKLQTKLLLLMILTFILSFSIFEWFDYKNIKTESMNNMRYEAKHIRSVLMATRRVYHKQFLASGIPLTDKTLGFLPAHSLSLISKDFENWTDDNLYFNNVSDHPRNQRNTADSIEREAISYFRQNPTEKERFVSFKSTEGEDFYHYSAPIWVEQYCLECHGKREDAPETIRNNYETSYDYKAGDLQGVMSIKLPATQLKKSVWNSFVQNLWLHLASFVGVFLVIAFLLYRYVTIPLSRIKEGMSTVGENEPYQKIEGLSGEMAVVANAFNQMSERLIARESLLRESDGRLRAIMDNTTAVIYLKDINGKYILINRRYENIFKISSKDIIGKTDRDIFLKNESDGFLRNDKKVLEFNKPMTFEETVQHDGDLHSYVSLKFPLLDNDNKAYGVCGISTDITDRKKMEEALSQSEKLKSIGTITAGISHEFNNILAIISGNVQLLEDAYKEDEVLTNALHIISKATNDGAEISGNMLKFTKTYQGADEFVSSDIRDMIMDCIDFTKPRWKNEAQSKGIDYKIDTESMKIVPCIMCKSSEIREIFINIIHNALDAMPEGGSILFSMWRVDDTVFISITDTGHGMTDDVKKNIFDPFFSTKGVDGTGLGMSMVYGVITRHGGKIDVISEIGKGSTFTLQFPVDSKDASLIETSAPEQETKTESLRVLVVDDEAAIRNILNKFLSRIGHRVKCVDNGADAINIIQSGRFDLVLCDIAMPDVSGYDVVNALNRLKIIPKIGMITGLDMESKQVEDKKLKVDFYLKKPFKLPELSDHINDAFGADSS